MLAQLYVTYKLKLSQPIWAKNKSSDNIFDNVNEMDKWNTNVTFRIINDVTHNWCIDVVQINGSTVWRATEQRAIVFGCALKHFKPCLDVPETWLPCNIYACMNIYCESEYACVKEGQMKKNKDMKTLAVWSIERQEWIVFSVKYKQCKMNTAQIWPVGL